MVFISDGKGDGMGACDNLKDHMGRKKHLRKKLGKMIGWSRIKENVGALLESHWKHKGKS